MPGNCRHDILWREVGILCLSILHWVSLPGKMSSPFQRREIWIWCTRSIWRVSTMFTGAVWETPLVTSNGEVLEIQLCDLWQAQGAGFDHADLVEGHRRCALAGEYGRAFEWVAMLCRWVSPDRGAINHSTSAFVLLDSRSALSSVNLMLTEIQSGWLKPSLWDDDKECLASVFFWFCNSGKNCSYQQAALQTEFKILSVSKKRASVFVKQVVCVTNDVRSYCCLVQRSVADHA